MAFITAAKPAILRELEQAMRWRVVKGFGVLLVDSMGVKAVDPSYYFPVKSESDKDTTVAHLLAYTYHERRPDEQITSFTDANEPANRIRFVFYDPANNVNTVQTYELSGDIIQQPVTSAQPADVRGMFVFGDGESYFTDCLLYTSPSPRD